MNRILAISLSFSVAAHLAVGGLASHADQQSEQVRVNNRIAITLSPVRVTDSSPEQPSTAAPKPAETSPVRAQTQPAVKTPAATSIARHEPMPTRQQETRPEADSEARQQIQQGLHRLFNTYFYYPRMAQRRGIEGIVHIGLHLSADGEISGIHLSKGSGMAILDKAALQSAQKITLYPESSRLLQGKSLDLIMPVKFQLTNG